MADNAAHTSRPVSRRTVAKGIAWTVPAITVATAVPAFATSGPRPVGSYEDGCKQPGYSCGVGFVKGYAFLLTLSNPSDLDIYIYDTTRGSASVTLVPQITTTTQSKDLGLSYYTSAIYNGTAVGQQIPMSLKIPANGSVQIVMNGSSDNSANASATGSIDIPWGHTETPGADINHPYTPTYNSEGWFRTYWSFTNTPPCTNCAP